MTSPSKPRVQLEALTGLRGLAAIFVVLYHIRSGQTNSLPDWLIALFSKGYLAVDLFFILSGFVMWTSYAAKFSEQGLSSTRHFLWRRLARIYPLHLAILSAMAAFAVVLKFTGRNPGPDMNFSELPLHLLLVQAWGLVEAVRWNDPAWSISAEFASYLCFPLIALGADWDRRSFATIAAAVAGLLIMIAGGFALAGHTSMGAGISEMGVFRCLTQFAIGTALASLWQRGRHTMKAYVFLGGASAIMGIGLMLRLDEPVFLPAALACLMLAAALANDFLPFLSKGPIHYLGQISYAVYLSHMFLYTLFKLFFVSDPSDVGLLPAAGFIVAMLAVSSALYHYLELPSQRWINGLFQPKIAIAAPASVDSMKCID